MKYPIYDDGHITNLENIKEIKIIPLNEIKEINELIKNGWIYITVMSDYSLFLGKPK